MISGSLVVFVDNAVVAHCPRQAFLLTTRTGSLARRKPIMDYLVQVKQFNITLPEARLRTK